MAPGHNTTILIKTDMIIVVRRIVKIKQINGEKITIAGWLGEAVEEKIERDGIPDMR